MYIYNEREDTPLIFPTMTTMKDKCKIKMMGVEEDKKNKEVCERLNQMEAKLMEWA